MLIELINEELLVDGVVAKTQLNILLRWKSAFIA
ncbi:hypothetical protein vBEcoMWL3_gp189c [Escherichia phage vB_EcoM_WL-3]|nr:hypothetical protein vBEcoMWL3_gp189c [Escherichia phage vB_EcoM_WL-3]